MSDIVSNRAMIGLSTKMTGLVDAATPLLAGVAVILFWEVSVRVLGVPTFLLPPPSLIISEAFQISPAQWTAHIWATMRVALLGYVVSILVSVPLAIALTTSRVLHRTLYPLLIIVQSLPVVAVAPIIVVTLGTGDASRVLITFLITFFPIVVSTTTGLMATPPELLELSNSLRASRERQIFHIRLPYALPHVFAALKVSTTLALIGAVVAEFVSGNVGLGYYIAIMTSTFRIPAAFSALVVLVVLSLSFFKAIDLLQRLVAPWSLPKT